MVEAFYDKINEYDYVTISLASPQDIIHWSYGEVKKPETINYRNYRPEKDGLFCERIFGPERDWECSCGKHKGIKHRGIICDRCGVKVTHSRARRHRMGHIKLAAPVAHIWFFKAMPSRMGTLLGMKVTSLEDVIYFKRHVVLDPKDTHLKKQQLLTDEQLRKYQAEYGENGFEAGIGAEAIKKLLERLDLEALENELQEDYHKTKSEQKQKDIIKRLKIVRSLKKSRNKPEWMVLEVIPVIPPDLRPLVLLESGNFATSDLNDLYRRVINRNNRLKKLIELNAPEVIICNEKRMLQQSVDALFDNSRCKRPVLGSNGRPLKSLADMIKGKQGRFRENLLGKRVDYSGRSVIVVGPDLKLSQCGLPKKIALELFQPFIIRRLKDLGYADTIRSAKKMLERKDEQIWSILVDVIKNHPVLLNRAPTLHRMGIQAFEPKLIEGNAITIHPLVCEGFNADFDGDQMAVHLPLSWEAQVESLTLMLSPHNVFSPSNGRPIISPSHDMVLGCAYMTTPLEGKKGENTVFSNFEEVFMAYDENKIELHAQIKVRFPAGTEVHNQPGVPTKLKKPTIIPTTVGRVLFNDIIPKGMPFYNYTLTSKLIKNIIADSYRYKDKNTTLKLLDDLKDLGFKYATLSGITFSCSDLKMPKRKKEILAKTEQEVEMIEKRYAQGVLTEQERYNQIVDKWTHATDLIGKEMVKEMQNDTQDGKPYINPILLMSGSGARGSMQQVRQLAGMRGLMANPSGRIIETPIKANFREGLKVLEYFSSTHGARKGLADTALKTADAGYLTRKLADVAQSVVIMEKDCGTTKGITKGYIYKGDKVETSLSEAIIGRTARDNIVDLVTDETIVRENQLIDEEIAAKIEAMGLEKIRVRSPLTCESKRGVCALCYGMDLSRGKLAEEGLAVGIIAAQSIGEPGTQLTMRTFHIGGVVNWQVAEKTVKARKAGKVRFYHIKTVEDENGRTLVTNRKGVLQILDEKGRELEEIELPLGAELKVKDGENVKKGQLLTEWDPHMVPIIAEKDGFVKFEDLIPGTTLREHIDKRGNVRKIVSEHKGDYHPQIAIVDEEGKILEVHPVPEKANLEVEEGEFVKKGKMIAKTPREIGGTQDITGGLPRVTELFEVRKPKTPAVLSAIDGIVEVGERKRGKRNIIIRSDTGKETEHLIPQGKNLLVSSGDYVKAGEPLVDGPLIPHDILRISGEEAVQNYLLRQIQKVYRSQNVRINDKHIEIIISEMMRRVKVKDPGDTSFLPGSIVDKFQFREENNRVLSQGLKAATAEPLLLGITKSSLYSDSFISAASFQETTRVLTEAALASRTDELLGLKENVILGHMIPAGTGLKTYLSKKVKRIPPKTQEIKTTTSEKISANKQT